MPCWERRTYAQAFHRCDALLLRELLQEGDMPTRRDWRILLEREYCSQREDMFHTLLKHYKYSDNDVLFVMRSVIRGKSLRMFKLAYEYFSSRIDNAVLLSTAQREGNIPVIVFFTSMGKEHVYERDHAFTLTLPRIKESAEAVSL